MPRSFEAVTAVYSIRAAADPNIAFRLMSLFAKRGLPPDQVRIRRSSMLCVTIEQPQIAASTAGVIAAKMRELVMVGSIDLDCSTETMSAHDNS